MDHLRPDLHRDGHVGCAHRGCEPNSIIEQRFSRADLDQKGRKALQLGIKRRYSGIGPVDPGSHISPGKLLEVVLVDERVDRILADERCAGHRQVGPG